jgi:hypothetical protein
MLSRVALRLLGQTARSSAAAISTSARALAEEGGAAPAGVEEFKARWQQIAPSTLNPPEFPTSFLEPEEKAGGEPGAEDKFTVKVFTPNGTAAEGKVRKTERARGARGGASETRRVGEERGRRGVLCPSLLPLHPRAPRRPRFLPPTRDQGRPEGAPCASGAGRARAVRLSRTGSGESGSDRDANDAADADDA